jgi:hypothetical protein
LKKKSERNLRTVAEERQSQVFGQGANGVLRLLVSYTIFFLEAPITQSGLYTTHQLKHAHRSIVYSAHLHHSNSNSLFANLADQSTLTDGTENFTRQLSK